MTAVQTYLLVAPIVLLIVCGIGVGVFLYVTKEKPKHRPR